MPAIKMVPRRPTKLFNGSVNQQPKRAAEIYGLTTPKITHPMGRISNLRGVNDANNPLISVCVGFANHRIDIELYRKGEISSVGTSLIPSPVAHQLTAPFKMKGREDGLTVQQLR